jgi:hypothetical protein
MSTAPMTIHLVCFVDKVQSCEHELFGSFVEELGKDNEPNVASFYISITNADWTNASTMYYQPSIRVVIGKVSYHQVSQ